MNTRKPRYSQNQNRLRSPNESMHNDLKIGESPNASTHMSELTSKFYTAEVDICDGAVKLMRTKQSGEVWQMRCWVSAEKKYIKKSLRTKDLDSAQPKFYLTDFLYKISR